LIVLSYRIDWRREGGMEGYIDQIFRELPFGIAIAMVIFLGILLIIWLLLPLWVLFIQWNTSKIKDEIRSLVDQLERRERNGKEKETAGPND
jgi:dolichol kinase